MAGYSIVAIEWTKQKGHPYLWFNAKVLIDHKHVCSNIGVTTEEDKGDQSAPLQRIIRRFKRIS